METRVDIIDRTTIAIDFDSQKGHEVVLVRGEGYDDSIQIYQSNLLSNQSLIRCNYSDIKQAVKRYNSNGHPRTIVIIEDISMQ